jgi:hypothetical protein
MSRHLLQFLRAFAMLSLSATFAGAQATSPIDDLLTVAREELDKLAFDEADRLAADVLQTFDKSLRRTQRILALQIRAAARYPESDGERNAEQAKTYLREVVSLDLDAEIPITMRWSGLDALLEEVRAGTFGMSVRVAPTQTYGGTAGPAVVRVKVNQPAAFVLRATPRQGGSTMVLDSIVVASDTVLRIHALSNAQPILASGEWLLEVESRSIGAGDIRRRPLVATSSPGTLSLPSAPPPFEVGRLLPEVKRTDQRSAIIGASTILLGAIVVARAVQPSELLATEWRADGRATAVGIVGAIGTAAAWYFDRGEPIRANVLMNRQLRDAYALNDKKWRDDTQKTYDGYRATLAIVAEDR